MRQSRLIESQALKSSKARRLRELEHENGLLKLLYVDLLQKFSAVKKDSFETRGSVSRKGVKSLWRWRLKVMFRHAVAECITGHLEEPAGFRNIARCLL